MKRQVDYNLSEDRPDTLTMMTELHRIHETNKLLFMHFNELIQMRPEIIEILLKNKQHLSLVCINNYYCYRL